VVTEGENLDMKDPLRLIVPVIVVLILAACGDAGDEQSSGNGTPATETENVADTSPTTVSESISQDGQAYPGPSNNGYPGPYPPPVSMANSQGYPSPAREIDESKRFAFNEPMIAGQQEVSGTGPAGTPIRITSISFAGEELGRGNVSDDRTFVIRLSRPAEQGEVLAIMLGDDGLREVFHDAPGTDIPMIGFILAQSVVGS
jgi:hypothetical protein